MSQFRQKNKHQTESPMTRWVFGVLVAAALLAIYGLSDWAAPVRQTAMTNPTTKQQVQPRTVDQNQPLPKEPTRR